MAGVTEVVEALRLLATCRVNQRVPKKSLIENGSPTATDKRLLNNSIEAIHWVASRTPKTMGEPAPIDTAAIYCPHAVSFRVWHWYATPRPRRWRCT